MNRIITLGNLKGGAGKSTVAMLLALYLHEKGYNVQVIDGDVQHTIAKKRDEELRKRKENNVQERLYDIVKVEPSNKQAYYETLTNAMEFDGIVISDTPGNLELDAVSYNYRISNAVIVPYRYDDNVIDSTIGFTIYLEDLRKDFADFTAPIFYLPNNMIRNWGTAEERKIWDAVDKEFLMKHGTVLPPLPMRKHFQNLTTIEMGSQLKKSLEGYFDDIIKTVIEEKTNG